MPDLAELKHVSRNIHEWAMEQISPWRDGRLVRDETMKYINKLNDSELNVYIFNIKRGNVEVVEKPDILHNEHSYYRAKLYRSFLETTVRSLCPDLSTTLAIFVGDGALNNIEAPVFAFQKTIENNSPLLPDVGLIDPAFFRSGNYFDPVEYEEKTVSAIFAGSTTGGLITPEAIRNGSHPRIRAGRFFRGCDVVQFYLPNIVNHGSDEAWNMLRDLGFGGGEHISWSEQFGHLFLLSMDGYGPSPARIAIGLKSNGVLMHYVTEHVLYYFGGLQPWVHYLPIYADRDVLRMIEEERQDPGRYRNVAIEGKRFAENYLTPFGVMSYIADILQTYEQLFDDDAAKLKKARRQANRKGLEELSLLSSRVLELESAAAQEKGRGDALAAMFWKERERAEFAEAAHVQEKARADAAKAAQAQERERLLDECALLRERVQLLEAVVEEVGRARQIESSSQVWLQRFRSAATLRFLTRRRYRKGMGERMETTLKSGLFDSEWYLRANPDVAAKGADALRHYCASGYLEGRRPGPNADDASVERLLKSFRRERPGSNP